MAPGSRVLIDCARRVNGTLLRLVVLRSEREGNMGVEHGRKEMIGWASETRWTDLLWMLSLSLFKEVIFQSVVPLKSVNPYLGGAFFFNCIWGSFYFSNNQFLKQSLCPTSLISPFLHGFFLIVLNFPKDDDFHGLKVVLLTSILDFSDIKKVDTFSSAFQVPDTFEK